MTGNNTRVYRNSMLDHSDNHNNNNNDYSKERESNTSPSSLSTSTSNRYNILSIIETFIEQIFHIRKTLLGVSISALIMAPVAIGLSVYLLRHPSFIATLDMENEFGIVLAVLLGAIIITSLVWLVVGIRQYRLIGSWNKRYGDYIREKQERDRTIASQYNEDTTNTTTD
jgi:drug/metabolite transporter superfamily protein YnfA